MLSAVFAEDPSPVVVAAAPWFRWAVLFKVDQQMAISGKESLSGRQVPAMKSPPAFFASCLWLSGSLPRRARRVCFGFPQAESYKGSNF